MKTAFPVTDDSASVLGLITVNIAKAIPEPKRQYTLVEDIMIPRNELIIVDANRNADEALSEMARRKMNIIFVSDEEGNIVGLVTKTDILNIVAERQKYFHALGQK